MQCCVSDEVLKSMCAHFLCRLYRLESLVELDLSNNNLQWLSNDIRQLRCEWYHTPTHTRTLLHSVEAPTIHCTPCSHIPHPPQTPPQAPSPRQRVGGSPEHYRRAPVTQDSQCGQQLHAPSPLERDDQKPTTG